MRFQIQVRGVWGGASGDWRPAIADPAGDGASTSTFASSTFASWDDAEEALDRMQLAGLLPCGDLEPSGAELRIVELGAKSPRPGALEPGPSSQRAA